MSIEPDLALSGRTVVVTGVSRRQGIGFAIASRMAKMGASLFLQHHVSHDAQQPWGADSLDELVVDLSAMLTTGAKLEHRRIDLALAQGARELIGCAGDALGHLDVLCCNHAMSGSDGRLRDMTAQRLDAHWQENTRSTLLATRYFAEQHDGCAGGRVIWMTSGQHEGSMSSEIAYATSKAALAGITASIANDLIEAGSFSIRSTQERSTPDILMRTLRTDRPISSSPSWRIAPRADSVNPRTSSG